ncbi:MAG TPA: alpha/beta hydrolase [Mycobacteriales bacterium]|nr:alpha/beta hydrolase [Mycobacteriales bacterium]HWC34167.1 alpha/beta hydrolase [Mycobacteriales bacterium]
MRRQTVVAAVLASAVSAVAPAASVHAAPRAQVARIAVTTRTYGADAADTMTTYAPREAGRFPAVVFVHGGGWGRAQPNSYEQQFAATLARTEHWVVAVIGYPTWVADERHVEPAAVRRAVRLVAARPDVARGRLALWGESAGGQLALLTAYRGAKPHHSLVSAVVSISGPTDMRIEFGSLAQTALGAVTRFEGLSPSGAAKAGSTRYRTTSPVDLVQPDDPPTFQAISRHDPLVPPVQIRELATSLHARGVPHQTLHVPGSDHSTPIETERPPKSKSTVEELAIRFLLRAFARRQVGA